MSRDQTALLSSIRFLGVCKKALRRGIEWDFIGVSNLLQLAFYPQNLQGASLVVAFPTEFFRESGEFRFVIKSQSRPDQTAWTTLTYEQNVTDVTEPISLSIDESVTLMNGPGKKRLELVAIEGLGIVERGTSCQLMALQCPPLLLHEPSHVTVVAECEDASVPIGEFACAFTPPPPITVEERNAILSHPGATKAITLRLACGTCGEVLEVFVRVDTSDRTPIEGSSAVHVFNAPASWTCSCGANTFPLTYAKAGIHQLLRQPRRPQSGDMLGYMPLYQKGAVRLMREEYAALIASRPAEEAVQLFLERHQLLWAFLSPTKILSKPSLLGAKASDFGILTSSRTLYFVEIEKPQTKLLTKKGTVHSELQAGVDQIRDWRGLIQDHRLAILNTLGFREGEVHQIKYLLVAGTARLTEPAGLTKLHRNPFGEDIDFYCFDELQAFLYQLERRLEEL